MPGKGSLPGSGTARSVGTAVGGLSVAELSAGATMAVALAVIGFAWLEEMLFARFAVPLIIALATVLLYVLIVLVVIGVIALVVRYFRQKTP